MPRFRRQRPDDPPDQVARERAALDIHDNIVQGLAEAQMAFEVGRTEQAREAVERTLAQARRIVTEPMADPEPGDLRRASAADDA